MMTTINAIRLFTEVKNGAVAVDLPEGTRVEVFVIPEVKEKEKAYVSNNVLPTTVADDTPNYQVKTEQHSTFDVKRHNQPIRSGVTFDMVLKEQNYQPPTYVDIVEATKDLEWGATLDELLSLLTE